MEQSTIMDRFRQQEFSILHSVEPRHRETVKFMIIKYNLRNSILELAVKNMKDYKTYHKAMEKYLLEKEIYFNDMLNSIRNLGTENDE